MAIKAEVVSVATTATLICSGGGSVADKRSAIVKNPSGGATVYLGGAGVTTATGFPLAAGESVSVDTIASDDLYGIVASLTQNVNLLRTRSS